MRRFGYSTLVGAGVLALAAGVAAPGIASAADNDATQTRTYTFVEDGVVEDGLVYSVTPHDDCTVDFTLHKLTDTTPWKSRASYRVDNEAPYIPANPDDPYVTPRNIYRPVVATDESVQDVAKYDIGGHTATVDLTKSRKVPKGAGGTDYEVIEVPGVTPNATGEHTIEFGPYSGAYAYNLDLYKPITVTVTGCPTTGGTGSIGGSGSMGSLDFFGSLAGTED